MPHRASVYLAGAAMALAGCARPQPALYASAAEQPAYAERYPSSLDDARSGYEADEKQAGTLTEGFAKFPDALDKPSWPTVLDVVKTADQAGGTADFAAGMEQANTVRTFYADEKEPLHQRVAGSVNYAAKQKDKECDADLAGAAVGGMDRAFDQVLDDSVRAHNPAIRLIEDNQDAIGQSNVDKLEKQADQIALASYLVRVRLPQAKRDLDAALADASTVKSTLEKDQAQAEAVIANALATRQAKATAEKRRAAAMKARAALDDDVTAAKKLSAEMEQRTKAAQKAYDDALKALEDAIQAKADATKK